jgi:hypothetical protein
MSGGNDCTRDKRSAWQEFTPGSHEVHNEEIETTRTFTFHKGRVRADEHRPEAGHYCPSAHRQPLLRPGKNKGGGATPHDWYAALAYTVRDRLLKRWTETIHTLMKQDTRVVSYLSAEF